MNPKRKIFISAIIAVFVVTLTSETLSVFAHSGRTDGDGGHTNHSTGKYHWHHGYSAHQHEDRDGDGYPEYCPYTIQNDTETDYDCGIEDCEMEGNHGHILKDKTEDETDGDEIDIAENDENKVTWEIVLGIGSVLLIFWPMLLVPVEWIWRNVLKPIIARIKKRTNSKMKPYERLLKILQIGCGVKDVDDAIKKCAMFYIKKGKNIPTNLFMGASSLSLKDKYKNLLKIIEIGIGVTGIENVSNKLIDFYKAKGISFPDDIL